GSDRPRVRAVAHGEGYARERERAQPGNGGKGRPGRAAADRGADREDSQEVGAAYPTYRTTSTVTSSLCIAPRANSRTLARMRSMICDGEAPALSSRHARSRSSPYSSLVALCASDTPSLKTTSVSPSSSCTVSSSYAA